jgi:hypothetical protein
MADHTTNWILKLGDYVSGPLGKIERVQNSVVNKVHQLTENYTKLSHAGSSTAASLSKLNTTVAKMPHSITELKDKLSDLYGQLETTHSYKSLHNLRNEIAKTKAQLNNMETGGVGGGAAGIGAWIKRGLGVTAVYMAISKGIAIAKDAVLAFDEEAKARAQLKVGIKSTGGISGQTAEGLEQNAINRERETLFKHDLTMQSQGILLAFSKVRGRVFDQAIISAQDLSTRLKIDLPEATKMMGKALEDPIHGMRMLRMAGISFSDGQLRNIRKLMEQGDLYKVQLAILKGMQESYGGSAAAAAKAGIGPTQQLKNKIETLKEAIGERLTPAVNRFSVSFGNLVDEYRDFIAIPVSQKLIEEKISVVSLANQLFQHNINAERRNEIYAKLKEIAPEIVSGIDKENISWDKLRQNVSSYNDELQRSIALQSQRETIEPYAKKAYEAGKAVVETQSKMNELFAKAEQYSVHGSQIASIARSNFPDDQKIRLVEKLIKNEEGKYYGELIDIHSQLVNMGSKGFQIGGTTSLTNVLSNKQVAEAARDSVQSITDKTIAMMFPARNDTIGKVKVKPKDIKIPMGEGDDIGSLDRFGKLKDNNFIKDPNDVTGGTSRGSGTGGGKTVTVNVGGIKQEVHFEPGNYEKKKDEMKQELVGLIVDAASDAAILIAE